MEAEKSGQIKTPSTGRTIRAAASQRPREVEDAIAFLHSMLSLAEARGWSEVTDYFAGAMIGMAAELLGPKKAVKGIEDARDAIDAAGDFIQELQHPLDRVPVPFLKGAVAMIETTIGAETKPKEEARS